LEAYFSANIQDTSNRIQNEEIYDELLELKDNGIIMPEIEIPKVATIKNWMSRRTRVWKDEMRTNTNRITEFEEETEDIESSDVDEQFVEVEVINESEELVLLEDLNSESSDEDESALNNSATDSDFE